MGMAALQQVSTEIREEFKAGEHVVFGAHVDENMGDRVEITVLGATDLEAGLPAADVAPVAYDIKNVVPKTRAAHSSKLKKEAKETKLERISDKKNRKKQAELDQGTFNLEDTQRGNFWRSSHS